MMQGSPLVSIVVITYNSSKYILETLESAKAQTYQNIELIISDDGSKDETIVICRSWLDENKKRFTSSQILTVEQNTGIPANCNRGVKAAHGEWIKLIAGDDAFYEDAIEKFIEVVIDDSTVMIVQTLLDYFRNTLDRIGYFSKCSPRDNFFKLSPEKQHKVLLIRYVCFTPGLFFRRIIFDCNQFDEEYKLLEDYPFMLKLTSKGFKIDLLNITTVKYRISRDSVQYNELGRFFNHQQAKVMINILEKYGTSNLYLFHLKIIQLLNKYGLNKKNFFTKYIEMVFYKTINLILVNKFNI